MPTALLSVYDKTGIADLAKSLSELGWSLVSSGGTAKAIADAGVDVTDVVEWTGVPAILGHRVVTLHPKVHGGILADPTDAEHQADMAAYGITPIDLVVGNLYPFGADLDSFDHGSGSAIDMIDIGGPAMVRAAAKNHAFVGVVVDPAAYDGVVEELRADGELSAATRRRLARDAFAHTAEYDAAIVTWFDQSDDAELAANGSPVLPASIHLALEQAQPLRYGENPHQDGARYRQVGATSWWDSMTQHGGKELSYLNVFDTEAAWRLVNRFDDPAVVVVKHANPCGVALADDIGAAYVAANACDPVSAFGGIVAANRTVTKEMAEPLSSVFTEVVVAPGFDDDALEILTAKKNLRVMSANAPSPLPFDMRPVDGGLLVQHPDVVGGRTDAWTVVTDAQPSDQQWIDLEFAWQVCAAVSSNAIVYAKDGQAFGIGAGQQNRLDSARIAADRSDGRAVGGACASDAFFPFRDGLDAAAAAGITAVIQPGGSVRDEEVIAAANEHGITMVFTSTRHFRH
ncbi:bifunctional phosphoribosylaminoimidazolecarboxamide formyltransferase/IMP cyclohydrolase [Ilumatobacter coccineus]|uniref:Bifunctional purine biosynthesis protein PurH n=1 Tax=Ilumatobacter coccineus (strain NBRC 103263 / KCTC 29153 / YM16-304) TaxID=1313172 RepID=A0A6C7E8W0_ILUCY|nr:bifunctional phosphoribosylaminoimidazolecarboxamide formyltransferase/IMP cyclohydrolase [Ilumatobacter coccineus]BAN01038.1 phosphoribosylaminoimidazolecarboxamide formyltransferase/IMP cyclohydrolase [Ilumatobacter coccineus YM16-304]